ncbi:MAG TPA: sigma-70 family RNA polymerase sigma factor [Planctomycetota bacterium]|nr:sigma-70 family RNA polymerase sigma factor [Planctomycetota bacterium]
MKDLDTSLGEPGGRFPETAHDLLAGLRDPDGPGYRAALSALCRRYWKPVYTYVRTAWTKSNEDAKDLTQAYFLWLLEGNPLEKYDPARGTFRGYLKGTLRSFVGHQERALGALKRGGGATVISLEGTLPALEEIVPEARSADPEQTFEQVWIVDLVQRAVEKLRERYRSRGKEKAFQVYEDYVLSQVHPRPTYLELAQRYGLKEREVESTLESLRQEVRREIRAELAELAPDEARLEEEWNGLFGP